MVPGAEGDYSLIIITIMLNSIYVCWLVQKLWQSWQISIFSCQSSLQHLSTLITNAPARYFPTIKTLYPHRLSVVVAFYITTQRWAPMSFTCFEDQYSLKASLEAFITIFYIFSLSWARSFASLFIAIYVYFAFFSFFLLSFLINKFFAPSFLMQNW